MKKEYDDLRGCIEAGENERAAEEMNRLLKTGQRIDDEFAVLAAVTVSRLGDEELAWVFIREGLLCNGRNAMLYFLLGNYYEDKNVNQAWLCYENAEQYSDLGEELALIRERKTVMEEQSGWSVNAISTVIVNRGAEEYGSDCNRGIKAAAAENDIMLLSSDAAVPENAVFWLRMGLYEEERIGAVRSVSDEGLPQMSAEEYEETAAKRNVPEKAPYENVIGLSASALLIKRRALDETGLFDMRFPSGQGAGADFGVRLNFGGWKTVLCHNSVVFCAASGNGPAGPAPGMSDGRTREIFREKWGFDMEYYTHSRADIIGFIREEKSEPIRVLEIGCGCGATLNRIRYLYPAAEVSGIELNETVAALGAVCCEIRQGNIETIELPYERETFDYIIMGDVVEHLPDPQGVIKRLVPYLKESGQLLCSIPNLLYREVIANLLCGTFEYQDEGILDRTHVRFFTWSSIEKLMRDCGLKITEKKVSGHAREPEDEYTPIIDAICRIPGAADRSQFLVYQYIFGAARR